ncbi:cytochrome P450 [Paraburkholderia sp. LEh10]|uniref:cytochrome P450 n=1 Tax=Paraburkholderia sp. LEh10 TaxID=2821353 RepID=UPI001AE7B12C|nr:cytochrome P450 [Paraburkholderia sp. LEh10]MBP0590400.1 cytochrome P450 [Paraburkholderia sp. LEh10]
MKVSPATLDTDPFSDEVLENPYSFYEVLREAGPVVYLSSHDCYAVGRFKDVCAVASEHQRFTSSAGIGLADLRQPGAWRAPGSVSEIDPPEHTDVRGAFQKVLSPIVIRRWKDAFEEHAERVVDRLLDIREVDGVKDIAEEFVLDVFPRMVGLSVPRERLVLIGEMTFNQLGPDNERLKRSTEKAAPFMDWYAEAMTRERMLPGGFGEQLYQAEDAGHFPKGTALYHVRSFFRAGTDTTVASIGLTLNQLARHPEQFARLRDNPAAVRSAFDEGLRFESPAQVLFRTAVSETEIDGVTVDADKKIAFFMASANRDPRKWENPDVYDSTRDSAAAHRAFGHGAHLCLGQMIARQEAEAILGALSRRVRAIELSGLPRYRLINTLRTLDTLPLRVHPL